MQVEYQTLRSVLLQIRNGAARKVSENKTP
jgi:hypothetical protein